MFEGMRSDLVVTSYPTRAEWLEARAAADAIGASDAAVALGVSPYGTPWTLWESRHAPIADRGSADMTRGNRWEPSVLAEYEDVSGCLVKTPLQVFSGAEPGWMVTLSRASAPWLRQTPDAFSHDPRRGGELGQVEAKAAMKAHEWAPEAGLVIQSWRDEYAEIVPAHYAVQGYVQLIVTGLPWVDLCALVPSYGWLAVRYVRLERDQATQDALFDALGEWRLKHLIGGEPPDLDSSRACNRYLAKRFPQMGARRPERPATQEETALMVEMAELKDRMRVGKLRADLLRNQLLESAQGNRLRIGSTKGPYGQPQGGQRTTVDMDALREEAPELVQRHTRHGEPFASFRLYRFDGLTSDIGPIQDKADGQEDD